MQQTENRVAIYCRVSTVHQIDKDSLPMQRKDLISYADLILHAREYTVFEDAGYSGKNTDRPEFQRMMTMLRTGAYTHLLVWKIDRISRNLLDFATMYAELKQLGVTFVSRSEQFDTSTAMGEAMLKIILVFAELERNMTSERVTATMISRANAGKWNGGRIPYGYDYDADTMTFSVNEEEAAVVRRIHDEYEERKSLINLARNMNHDGLTTRSGVMWNPVSLSLILRSRFYTGDYEYNRIRGGTGKRNDLKDKSEWVTVTDHHPSIISRSQKERILQIMDQNTRIDRQKYRKSARGFVHLFGGLIYCGSCGHLLRVSSSGEKKDGFRYTRYICPTRLKSYDHCQAKSTSDPVLGEIVFGYILNMINAQNSIDTIGSPLELQDRLLTGSTFHYIDHIEETGLKDLYTVLKSGKVRENIYGASLKLQPSKKPDSELTRLRREIEKTQKALERLRSLYLIDDSISEKDFILQRQELINREAELQEKLDTMNSDYTMPGISDEEFLSKASQFILTQKLTNRKSISFTRLMKEIEPVIIRDFLLATIDRITINGGLVSSITFRNGLSHTFVYKTDLYKKSSLLP